MKPPVPPQPSPSQKNLAATVTLGLLMVAFLLIPVLAPRPSLVATTPPAVSAFVGPAVPLDQRPWHPNESEAAWAPSSGFVGQMQRMALALVFMSVVIFISLKMANRFFPGLLKPGGAGGRTQLMEVLERQSVGPGVNLAIVRVGTKTLVLGMTDHSVSTVCELGPEDMPVVEEPVVVSAEPAPAPADVYKGIFRQYLSIIPGMGGTKR